MNRKYVRQGERNGHLVYYESLPHATQELSHNKVEYTTQL